MKYVIALVGGCFLFLASSAGVSAASDATCSAARPLPPGIYRNVQANAGCLLNASHVVEGTLVMYLDGGTTLGPDVQGTRIRGDVAIFGGGFVEDAHIGGSVFLLDAYAAGIRNSYVGGDVWTGNGFGATYVTGNEVRGSILLDGAGSDEVIASDNVVGGDLSISRIGGNFNFDGNEIAGNLRLVDASPYNFVASTVRGNQVGGRLEIARNRLADFPENPPGLDPTFIVADNVVGQHAGMFENDGLQLLGNVIGGVLLCQGNGEFTQSGNVARGRLGQCQ